MSDHFKGWQDGHLPPPEIPEQEHAEQIKESGGPTVLDIGAIADGGYLKRSGTDIVGTDVTEVKESGGQLLGLGAIPNNSVLARSGTDIVGQGVWQTWTPTWAASTTNPSKGNGTLSARYTRIGGTIFAMIFLQFGSTTNAGSGSWNFSYPVTPADFRFIRGSVATYVDGTPSFGGLWAQSTSVFYLTTSERDGKWFYNPTTPAAWTNGDWMRILLIYEV